MTLTYKQEQGLREAVRRYRNGDRYITISGYAGSGKAQPIDTIIPTPEGNKKLKDIAVGDYIFDRLGRPTRVLGVYPQGEKTVYTLKLKDGRSTKCAGDHLWTVLNKKNQQQTLTTEELLSKGLINSAGFKYAVPNNLPLEYSKKEYDIDPYVIGAFLGDGCCCERQLTLSSENEEIPEIVKGLIGAKSVDRNSETNYNWTFTLQNPIINLDNKAYFIYKFQTNIFFKNYQKELCCSAQEKSIPEIYKRGSVQQRLDLLQGLLDTDGTIGDKDENRFNIRFTSTSYQLILDTKEVLQSLGYSSTISQDLRSEKYSNGSCYSLNINIPNEEKVKLFRLKRKKDIAIKAQQYIKHKNYTKNSIIDIVKESYQTEMVCIYVDNLEHLYLTNDCIVTHNTTLVKYIIEALGVSEDEVVYATPTGKAAQVLAKKGNRNAMTLHKLLYTSHMKDDGTYTRIPKEDLEPYSVIVVDEVSMVPVEMIKLLSTHAGFFIFLGDPAQLPPINKDEDNHLLDTPHIFLDEIMRQAQESEIIRLTMDIRAGKPLAEFHGSEVQIFKKKDFDPSMLTWADQIICGTNKKRVELNNQTRELLGFQGDPQEGEKVVCLHNYWDRMSLLEAPLVNGCFGYLKNPRIETVLLSEKYGGDSYDIVRGNFMSDTDEFYSNICMDKQMILTGEKCISPRLAYVISKDKKLRNREPLEFTFGYAATVHKFQGSSAEKILGIEENFPYDKETHKKLLYTMATRAEKKLVIIKK